MTKMECPICGEMFEVESAEHLDNGNPACPRCVEKERQKENEDKK